MSFILDALKKLEQKRQAGSVPDLMTVHPSSSWETKKRSLLPFLFVLVLLINAVILSVLLFPDRPEKQEAVQAPVPVQQESPPASPEPDRPAAVTAETSLKEASPAPAAPSAITLADSVSADRPVREQPAPSEPAQPADMPEEPVDEAVPDAQVGLNPSPREIEILRETIKEEYASMDDEPQPEMPAPEDPVPERGKEAVEFDQLPSDIKKEIPSISIKGHIYSNNPSARIVNVNGIIIREGDTVTAGLKVEEITMTGIIFDYGGLRFRIRAF